MTNFPLISCIIPVYNVEQYIVRCLDSVCRQTYQNWELILVDDGSCDRSGNICDYYAMQHANIQVVHQINNGASLARKKGLELAKGQYVTFIDSDDYVTNDYLEVLYRLITTYHTCISACKMTHFVDSFDPPCRSKGEILQQEQVLQRFFNYDFWGFWGKVYVKEVFNGLYFPKATLSEDYAVMIQVFNRYTSIAYTDDALYMYEPHANSLSKQRLSERAFDEYENVKYVYEFTQENFPRFTSRALKNMGETCVKLLMMKSSDHEGLFSSHFSEIKRFMYHHWWKLMCCKSFLFPLKVLATGLIICPRLAANTYKIIKKGNKRRQ